VTCGQDPVNLRLTILTLRVQLHFPVENADGRDRIVWYASCSLVFQGHVRMLKISVVDGQRQRRILVEGSLIAGWTDELVTVCEEARADPQGLELVVDVKGLTTISAVGANLLLKLMRDKIKLQCGVYVRELLRQLARDARLRPDEAEHQLNDAESEPEEDEH
jgi:hypothetical protein